MPNSCFSYPADVPLGTRNRNTAQRAMRDLRRMPVMPCFSYPADVPLGIKNRSAAQPAPRNLPSMPGGNPDFVTTHCFSYPATGCFRY